jgi:competence protein ComFC
MKTTFYNVGKAFVNLVYPPLCLHCKESVKDDSHILCESCLSLLQLIDPAERCPHCFSAHYFRERRYCPECQRTPPLLNAIAAAFDYVGPAASLIRKLKYSEQSYLAKGCGAYLAAQFLQLEWPLPDVIIPVPISLTHLLERGYNQSLLIAKSMAEILNCPVQDALYRGSGDYSQAGLSRKQRMQLDGSLFSLKIDQQLRDKTLLVIDDVMTTGSTLRKCAEALMEECPAKIYGLAICRAT